MKRNIEQKDMIRGWSKFLLLTLILNFCRQAVSVCLSLPGFGLNIAAPKKGHREDCTLSRKV